MYVMSGDLDYFDGKDKVNIPAGVCYTYENGSFNRFLIFQLMRLGYKYDPRYYDEAIIKAAAAQIECTTKHHPNLPTHLFGGS
jgi:hypothetical protein